MILQQVHNPKQAWKSLHDLHCNHNLVGNCTYLASKVVQINKNELMKPLRKVGQTGCLLISAYPNIRDHLSWCVHVCVYVSQELSTPPTRGPK